MRPRRSSIRYGTDSRYDDRGPQAATGSRDRATTRTFLGEQPAPPARSSASTAVCVPNSSATDQLSRICGQPNRPLMSGWPTTTPLGRISRWTWPHRHNDSPQQPHRRHHRRRPKPPAPTAAATTGSAAECAPTASYACHGNRSASDATTPEPAVMSTSTAICCGFGSVTIWSKPPPAPAPARYETKGPCAPTTRPNNNAQCQGSTDIKLSTINRR